MRTQTARFATAFMAVLDVETRSVRYCNAGHVPGLVVRLSGGVDVLTSTGPPLGLIERLPFAAADTSLEEGDLLVLVSDGLTEAESPQGEEFGLGRLKDLLLEQRSLALDELAEVVHVSIADFTAGAPPNDDRTILLARCRSTAS